MSDLVWVFKYDAAKHNVVKVNGTAFKDCVNPPGSEVSTSGNDIITLKTAGNKWYLCGKPNHCNQGQKLSISVMDMSAPEPSPSAAHGIIFSGLFQAFTAVFALFMAFN
ncbi:stellacyanin-like [Morus notabilis]|uniref:stellacyanin-like n=1 Tax=Morus notabilis TaxID=981085 RepID=UPI000CECECCC|nr:stellacyanin-like [Morus notabilis]